MVALQEQAQIGTVDQTVANKELVCVHPGIYLNSAAEVANLGYQHRDAISAR
jgi:hypothetical protein